MAEYLDRDLVIENVIAQMRRSKGEDTMRERLLSLYTADVSPVIHAKWVDTDPETPDWSYKKNGMAYYCSACGHPAGKHKHKTYRYCPWCGALMVGGAK